VFGIGVTEMMVLGVLGLLLFGSRLPEVARSLGKGMREFKEGMSGIQNEFNSTYSAPVRTESRPASRPVPTDEEDRGEFVAPKFEPPPIETAELHEKT
jgi:sec-independent protein translocase protein TatA